MNCACTSVTPPWATVSPATAADLLGVSVRQVYYWLKDGSLVSTKTGRRRRINVTDVDAFLVRRQLEAIVATASEAQVQRARVQALLDAIAEAHQNAPLQSVNEAIRECYPQADWSTLGAEA